MWPSEAVTWHLQEHDIPWLMSEELLLGCLEQVAVLYQTKLVSPGHQQSKRLLTSVLLPCCCILYQCVAARS